MTIHADQPVQKPLRLWPGVAAVVLQWLALVCVPIVSPDARAFRSVRGRGGQTGGGRGQLGGGRSGTSEDQLVAREASDPPGVPPAAPTPVPAPANPGEPPAAPKTALPETAEAANSHVEWPG